MVIALRLVGVARLDSRGVGLPVIIVVLERVLETR
jgi:hypothetical protein